MLRTESPRFPAVSVSVIIPAYNEELNVQANLVRALESLRRVLDDFELIFIDDASSDRTGDLALEVARRYPQLHVYRNDRNLKQGGSLERGFDLARCEWVMHNAIDYPFDFDDLPALLPYVRSANVIVARRKSYPGISRLRAVVSWGNRLLLRSLFGTRITDFNFVQLYRRSVLQGQASVSHATSFITPEKIIRAQKSGYRVVEVEVEYRRRERGAPSSVTVANILRALLDMLRLRFDLWAAER